MRGLRLRASTFLLAGLTVAVALSGAATAAAKASVDVYPFPGSRYEMPYDQIAFRGIPAGQIGTITVVGSRSGKHSGTIEADSDGNGGSFLPARPFDRGETVTVTTSLNLTGAPNGKFTFRIAAIGAPFPAEAITAAPVGSDGIQHFHSVPGLTPPTIDVTENKAPASDGDIFVAPQFGPTQNGPMILNSSGQLVWFDPIPISDNVLATDFRVQQLYGQPVLTWFQGTTGNGNGRGVGMVFNHNYQLQQEIRAADGLTMDLHEFLITNSGQAYIIAVQPVYLPGVHRPVSDGIVQEIDMKTGLVLFDWNALDHIPLQSSSYFGPHIGGHVLDPFHLNSIAVTSDNNLLISSRNTSAVFKVDRDTGQTIWTMGGKKSTFKMGPGTSFALQHDVEVDPDGTITLFDDGAGPPRIHATSNALRLSVNTSNNTVSLVRAYNHNPGILAFFEGSTQTLSDGNVFTGWGQQPYFTEFNSAGAQIFDAHFVAGQTGSYRAYRFPWSAQPPTNPSLGLVPGPNGSMTAYGSWNGATDVAQWRVLAGNRAGALTALKTAPVHGFETGVTLTSGDRDYEIQALGSSGQVLATSSLAGSPEHVAIYGRSAFVATTGAGAVPVGCFALNPCKVVTTLMNGTTVLARTGAESVGANETGLAYFRLSSAALTELIHNHSWQVTINVTDTVTHRTASEPITMVSFSTSGSGPTRTFAPRGPLYVLGGTDFVSSSTGYGGILTACTSATICSAKTTISVGNTVIATTGTEAEGPGSAGYLGFSLNATGRSMLAHASGHQLGVEVKLTGPDGVASSAFLALVPFS